MPYVRFKYKGVFIVKKMRSKWTNWNVRWYSHRNVWNV